MFYVESCLGWIEVRPKEEAWLLITCLRLRYRLIIIESDAERESFPVNNSPEPVLVDVRSIMFEYEKIREGIITLSGCREKPELKD